MAIRHLNYRLDEEPVTGAVRLVPVPVPPDPEAAAAVPEGGSTRARASASEPDREALAERVVEQKGALLSTGKVRALLAGRVPDEEMDARATELLPHPAFVVQPFLQVRWNGSEPRPAPVCRIAVLARQTMVRAARSRLPDLAAPLGC